MKNLSKKEVNEAAKKYASEMVKSAPTEKDRKMAIAMVSEDFKAGYNYAVSVNCSTN